MTLQELSHNIAKRCLDEHKDLDIDLECLQAVCEEAADLYLQTDTKMSDEAFITARLNIAIADIKQRREQVTPQELDFVSAHIDLPAFLRGLLADAKVLEVTGSNEKTYTNVTYLTTDGKRIRVEIGESVTDPT